MTEQHDLQEIYESLLTTANELIVDHDPLAIAACMLAQALSIYRTALTEEDYNRIIDNISAKRDKIKVFTPDETLH
jgi:hypothetical protein